MASNKPKVVISENVINLLQSKDGHTSDTDYILGQLRSLGYFAKVIKLNCESYGSAAVRTRIYFLAVLNVSENSGQTAMFVNELMDGMKIGSCSWYISMCSVALGSDLMRLYV